jgi:hypothetical protein
MILPQVGSLKLVSSMLRFQRRLESPYSNPTNCHSNESWNLPHDVSSDYYRIHMKLEPPNPFVIRLLSNLAQASTSTNK